MKRTSKPQAKRDPAIAKLRVEINRSLAIAG